MLLLAGKGGEMTRKDSKRILVRRITVDEKLADDIIRLAVCPLIAKAATFTDKQRDWGFEKNYIFTKDTFQDVLRKWGVLKPDMKKVSWYGLEEGQVYLLGNFRIEEIRIKYKLKKQYKQKDKVLKKFIVDRKKFNFVRIDEWVDEIMKRLYFSTLKQRKPVRVKPDKGGFNANAD
jgi:hypothetical protein